MYVWVLQVGQPDDDHAKSRLSSSKKLSRPDNVEGEVTSVPKVSVDSASETTGTAELVTELDVAQDRHEDLLHRVNQIYNPEILLRDVCDAQFHSLVLFFRVYGIDHETGILSFPITATKAIPKACEGLKSEREFVL